MAAKQPHCCPKYVVPVDMALECVYECCSSSVTMDFVHLLRDGTSLQQIVKSSSWHASNFLSCKRKQAGMAGASLKTVCLNASVDTWKSPS